MKLREDQERLQGLLKETITLLCKNGLHFKKNFQVKALIGITTDDDSLFMVDINETVGEPTDGIDGDDSRLDSSMRGDDSRSRGSRKRPPDGGSHGSASKRNRTDDDYDDDSDADISGAMKDEPGDEDLMFVKQEGTDYESHQYSGQDNFDTSSHDGSTTGQWSGQNPANMDPNQMALAAQSQSGSQQVCTHLSVLSHYSAFFSLLCLSSVLGLREFRLILISISFKTQLQILETLIIMNFVTKNLHCKPGNTLSFKEKVWSEYSSSSNNL